MASSSKRTRRGSGGTFSGEGGSSIARGAAARAAGDNSDSSGSGSDQVFPICLFCSVEVDEGNLLLRLEVLSAEQLDHIFPHFYRPRRQGSIPYISSIIKGL